ncbi:heterokaryon incompatibility protein-domain-containing protein [Aspergillus pseudoustus]|uniref:Heterokaryon incompatibility protein-domain-containing protein n=1 Tax=Aspergillus pseudoustus TaxID=1810923 RepID=A0ABR4JHI7_9EURO
MSGGKRFINRFSRIFKPDSTLKSPAPTGDDDRAQVQQEQEPAPTTASTRDANNPDPNANDGEDEFTNAAPIELISGSKFWSFFDFTEQLDSTGFGSLHYDFMFGLQGEWGRGRIFPRDFVGPRMFHASANLPDTEYSLPKRLYDVVDRRLYQSAELPPSVGYAAISHVWGPNVTTSVDGSKYGVPWAIPIKDEAKLESIFEAARVLLGERYIWMDVLCLDQGDRASREAEIADMGRYYRHATGCLVVLDNAYRDCAWERDILGPLEEINDFFKQDMYGMPKTDPADVFGGAGRGARLTRSNMGDHDGLQWIQRVRRIETAPWFRRVWTLQEAVLSRNLLLCTRERRMTTFATLLMIVSMVEGLMRALLSVGAESQGLPLLLELQQSEVYKILKLRQLRKQGQIGFWHLAQAVRSRTCTLEHDRVLGVVGMLQRSKPVVNSNLDIKSLWHELWQQALADGDFSACLYLGERPSPVAGLMCPDAEAGMGFISMGGGIHLPPSKESDILELADDGLEITNVGAAFVKCGVPLVCTADEGPLHEWSEKFLDLIDFGPDIQKPIATAWGLPSHQVKLTDDTDSVDIVPGAWAAYGALNQQFIDPIVKALGEEFTRQVWQLSGRALLQKMRIGHLVRGLGEKQDFAVVLLLMVNAEPQLAIITEPVDAPVVAITPSSYHETPGPGCLICKLMPDNGLRKVGVGLGKAVRADCADLASVIRPPLGS